MKFIALRDFRNHAPKSISVEGGARHPAHIHKGSIIEIDSQAKEVENLSAQDQVTVALLANAHAIGRADDDKLLKKIKAEVSVEEKAAARIAGTQEVKK